MPSAPCLNNQGKRLDAAKDSVVCRRRSGGDGLESERLKHLVLLDRLATAHAGVTGCSGKEEGEGPGGRAESV